MTTLCSALVTGANRGIGFEVVRQLLDLGYRVILTARKESNVLEAIERLCRLNKCYKDNVIGIQLDVCSMESVLNARHTLRDQFIGIVVNNAGVFLDDPRGVSPSDIFRLPIDDLRTTIETNVMGALRVMQAFIPAMLDARYGRVVNVSSGMGRTVEFDSKAPYYRLSKAALITLTRLSALSVSVQNVKINAVCPGWVRSSMGGENAIRSVEEGAKGIVLAATLSEDGPSGELLRDGKIFDWVEPMEALHIPKGEI